MPATDIKIGTLRRWKMRSYLLVLFGVAPSFWLLRSRYYFYPIKARKPYVYISKQGLAVHSLLINKKLTTAVIIFSLMFL